VNARCPREPRGEQEFVKMTVEVNGMYPPSLTHLYAD
jgi:hypothetical protein